MGEEISKQEVVTNEDLIRLVIEWGKNKGILGEGENALKQIDKTYEELNETRDALVKRQSLEDLLKSIVFCKDESVVVERIIESNAEIKDGIGDVLVTLIMLATISGLEINECLLAAYEEIKGRTGKMVNGIFVKNEVAAPYEQTK